MIDNLISSGMIWVGNDNAPQFTMGKDPRTFTKAQKGLVPGAAKARELCQLITDGRAGAIGTDLWFMEPKIDGIRALWCGDRFLSREGSSMECCSHIVSSMIYLEMLVGGPVFVDGEYLHPNGFDATLSDFRRKAGAGMFIAFDFLPMSSWSTGKPDPAWPIERRKMVLETVVREVNSPYLAFLPGQKLSPGAEGARMVCKVMETGMEGVVLKRVGSLYARGRGNEDMVRLKNRSTADITVVDQLDNGDLLCRGDAGTVRVRGVPKRDQVRIRQMMGVVSVIVEVSAPARVGARNQPLDFLRIREDKHRS